MPITANPVQKTENVVYTGEINRNSRAVTDWIHSYMPVFDPIKYAIKMKAINKRLRNKGEVIPYNDKQIKSITLLRSLKLARQKNYGNAVAAFIELWGMDKTTEPMTGMETAFLKCMDDNKWTIEAIEKKVSSSLFQLDGSIDMVCRDQDNQQILIDFKTVYKLDSSYGKMTGVFSRYDSTNLNLFSMQLHTYNILFNNKEKPNLLIIVLYPDGNYKIVKTKDMREVVAEALKVRYSELNPNN